MAATPSHIVINRNGTTAAFELTIFSGYDADVRSGLCFRGSNTSQYVEQVLTRQVGQVNYVSFMVGAGWEPVTIEMSGNAGYSLVTGLAFDAPGRGSADGDARSNHNRDTR